MRKLPFATIAIFRWALTGVFAITTGTTSGPVLVTQAQYPLDPHEVVNAFSPPPQPWSPGHRGVDLRAQIGQPIQAPLRGSVHFAGIVADRSVLSIRLDNGDLISLEPVSTSLQTGDVVALGQEVGRVSAAPGHCAPEVCLHLGLRRDGTYVDPLVLWPKSPAPIILLPPIEADLF